MTPPPVSSVLDLIGNTPLYQLTRLWPELETEVYAKLEFFNPGFSIKDRPALGMILDAERLGLIEPGDTIVEPTAGNTGVGLALVGVQRGYKVVLVVPDCFSEEKVKLMKALGAEVVRTPEDDGMLAAIEKAKEMAEELPRAYLPNQFYNPSNPDFHYETTAREIDEALPARSDKPGKLDAVVLGIGSGGAFTGIGRYFLEQNPLTCCVAVEPQGSILGGGEKGKHDVEGIGLSFYPGTVDYSMIDDVETISDDISYDMVAQLAAKEGLLVGGSSGANCAAAFRVARRLPPGSRVVTVFSDAAERYLSKDIFRSVPSR